MFSHTVLDPTNLLAERKQWWGHFHSAFVFQLDLACIHYAPRRPHAGQLYLTQAGGKKKKKKKKVFLSHIPHEITWILDFQTFSFQMFSRMHCGRKWGTVLSYLSKGWVVIRRNIVCSPAHGAGWLDEVGALFSLLGEPPHLHQRGCTSYIPISILANTCYLLSSWRQPC